MDRVFTLRIQEQSHHASAENEIQHYKRNCRKLRKLHTGLKSHRQPCRFSGSQVLGSIAGKTGTQCHKRIDSKGVQLDRSGIPGYHRGTITIHNFLYKQISDA